MRASLNTRKTANYLVFGLSSNQYPVVIIITTCSLNFSSLSRAFPSATSSAFMFSPTTLVGLICNQITIIIINHHQPWRDILICSWITKFSSWWPSIKPWDLCPWKLHGLHLKPHHKPSPLTSSSPQTIIIIIIETLSSSSIQSTFFWLLSALSSAFFNSFNE